MRRRHRQTTVSTRALAGILLALSIVVAMEGAARAALAVYVDFASDLHNGAGTAAPNGVADWIDELNQMATAAGIGSFTPAERSAIESQVLAELNTIYAGYAVTFGTSVPGTSPYDSIYMGYDNNTAGFPVGTLGFSPLDIANVYSSQTTNVAPASFDFIVESGDPRATQITELYKALAGTAAHELGHSLGLLHHDAYSDPAITPATYAATGGLQNQYIMATGPTGLNEAGREVTRVFSPREKAMFDIAGGAAGLYPTLDNQSLVASPVALDATELLSGDAGATLGTAMPLSFTAGASSGLDLAFVFADLELSGTDTDVFSFSVAYPGTLVAEIFSNNRYASPYDFDAAFDLLNAAGTVIASNDDVYYSGNVFNGVTKQQEDPFLLNIPLTAAGAYYLRVSPSTAPDIPAENGTDNVYWLLVGVQTIPEPGVFVLLSLAVLGVGRRRGMPHRGA